MEQAEKAQRFAAGGSGLRPAFIHVPLAWSASAWSLGIIDRAATIVTEKVESEELERQISFSEWTLHDVILDDGTWLPDTMVFEHRAFGLLIGGHTVFQFFCNIPQLAGRAVTHDLRLRRRHGSLLFGWWLRRRWARQAGLACNPAWRAPI